MLVDVAAAWHRADAEQRLRVQNFLFQDGIAYHQNQKVLNTTNPTLFQQLRGLAHCERVVGVPDRTTLNRFRLMRSRVYHASGMSGQEDVGWRHGTIR